MAAKKKTTKARARKPASDGYVYLDWRDNCRQMFTFGDKRITLVPSADPKGRIKNRVDSSIWEQIRNGKARRYIQKKLLVETSAPVDDVEEELVHVVHVERGIIESKASARARGATDTQADLRAKLEATLRELADQRSVSALNTEVIAKLEEQAAVREEQAAAQRQANEQQREQLNAKLAKLEKETAELRANNERLAKRDAAGQPDATQDTPPFDIAEIGANEVAAKIVEHGVTKSQLEQLLLAEVTGKNRKAAVAAIADALKG